MSDKNPDVLDQAAEVTSYLTERAVAEQRAKAAPESHPDFDGSHCVEEECGVLIPGERLALGKVRCVECQSRIEQAARGWPTARWS